MSRETRVIYVPGWAHGGEEFAATNETLFTLGVSTQIISARALLGDLGHCVTGIKLLSGAQLVVGWSLGAIALLSLLAQAASPLPAFLLLSPTPSFLAREGFPWGVGRAELVALRRHFVRDPEVALGGFFGRMLGEPAASPVVMSRVRDAIAQKKEDLIWGLDFLEQVDLRAALTNSDVSYDAVYGVRDSIVPPAASVWLARNTGAIRRATGAGHDVLHDSPAFVSHVIRSRLL